MNIETGDIILFHGNSFISKILEYFGKSKYSHVGIIIKNPKMINESIECDDSELYILHASFSTKPDIENHQIKYGVQIEKLKDVINSYPNHSVYIRKVKNERDQLFYDKIKDIHREIHGKPYDLHIKDWIEAKLNLDHPIPINTIYKHTNYFWCSALVSYIYFKLGWITECNWSLVAPREFSSIESSGQLLFVCIIDDEKLYS